MLIGNGVVHITAANNFNAGTISMPHKPENRLNILLVTTVAVNMFVQACSFEVG